MSVVRQRDKWVARVMGAEGKRHSRSFSLKSDAQKWERAELQKAERGEMPSVTRRDARTVTSIGDAWIGSLGVRDLKPKTILGYEGLWVGVIRPHWGTYKPRTIQPQAIRDWVTRLNGVNGKSLSKSRKTQALQVLAMVLDEAVLAGLLASNPARSSVINRAFKGAGTKAPREHRYLSAMELRSLSALAGDHGDFVFFMGTMGLRWAEATALTVCDVKANKVTINKSATETNGKRTVVSTKSGKARTVIMPQITARRIAHLLLSGNDELMFRTSTGSPLLHGNFHRRVWLPTVKAAGMNGLRIHDLRHTAASLAVASGANIKAVQNMLGHASATVTLDRYAGLFTSHLDEVADRMDELFASADIQQNTNTASLRPLRKVSL